MQYTFWVMTNKVGSKCEWTQEVDDEDLEGLTDSQKNEYLYDLYREMENNFVEFGWMPKEAEKE